MSSTVQAWMHPRFVLSTTKVTSRPRTRRFTVRYSPMSLQYQIGPLNRLGITSRLSRPCPLADVPILRFLRAGLRGARLFISRNRTFRADHLGTAVQFSFHTSRSVERSDVLGHPCELPFCRFLRIESPRISIRWALCTSRSRIPSANVGSPICSCQRETGS